MGGAANAGDCADWSWGAVGGKAGFAAWPKPPRAQSTTLESANEPQMSSAVGGDGRATGLDQSDAGWTWAAGVTFHGEVSADDGAPLSPLAELAAAVGGAAQLCDIGPVPEIAAPGGRASQLSRLAAGAEAASLVASQPCHCGAADGSERARIAAASSSAAAISNRPTRNTSPAPSKCGPGSRAGSPSRNVPLVLRSISS